MYVKTDGSLGFGLCWNKPLGQPFCVYPDSLTPYWERRHYIFLGSKVRIMLWLVWVQLNTKTAIVSAIYFSCYLYDPATDNSLFIKQATYVWLTLPFFLRWGTTGDGRLLCRTPVVAQQCWRPSAITNRLKSFYFNINVCWIKEFPHHSRSTAISWGHRCSHWKNYHDHLWFNDWPCL